MNIVYAFAYIVKSRAFKGDGQMKTEKKILLAFFLNVVFSVVEFVGGAVTGSIAITSDAIHDLGDSLSIGLSFILENISQRGVDETHTYGYRRYSVLGSGITTLVLLTGSVLVIYHAVLRLANPVAVDYRGMAAFAVAGVLVNLAASFITAGKESLNQHAVNLHMLEDVLGWVVVLVGAAVMGMADMPYLDPLLSIGVAVFILVNAIRNGKAVLAVFLEKVPAGVSVEDITRHLCAIPGVQGVHHMHVWSMDGEAHYATLHLVTKGDVPGIKALVRQELAEHGIVHATLETEQEGEVCEDFLCTPVAVSSGSHHHHHGHRH